MIESLTMYMTENLRMHNIKIMNDRANMKVKPITYEDQPPTLLGRSVG